MILFHLLPSTFPIRPRGGMGTRCADRVKLKFSKHERSVIWIFRSHFLQCSSLSTRRLTFPSCLGIRTKFNISVLALFESFVVCPSLLITELKKKTFICFFPDIFAKKSHYHYVLVLTNSICFLAIIFSLSVITNGAESCVIFFHLFYSCHAFISPSL